MQFEGLVETQPRRGYRVTPISISDFSDILDMRQALEVAVAQRIVRGAAGATLDELDRRRDADDIRAFASCNRNFHTMLAQLSDNLRLGSEMRRLLDAYERLCIVRLS